MLAGRCRVTRAMAAWTSWAAASMSRSRANCSVIWVLPSELAELIESTPAMVENSFSSGFATDAAIVCGLAPGSPADTEIVGKSTFGRSFTRSSRYAMIPKMRMPAMTIVVITGRLMNSPEKPIPPSPAPGRQISAPPSARRFRRASEAGPGGRSF